MLCCIITRRTQRKANKKPFPSNNLTCFENRLWFMLFVLCCCLFLTRPSHSLYGVVMLFVLCCCLFLTRPSHSLYGVVMLFVLCCLFLSRPYHSLYSVVMLFVLCCLFLSRPYHSLYGVVMCTIKPMFYFTLTSRGWFVQSQHKPHGCTHME